MTPFVLVRAETQSVCTGVADTPDVLMGVSDMPSVCTVLAEMPPDHNRMTGTPLLVQEKRSGLMTSSVK